MNPDEIPANVRHFLVVDGKRNLASNKEVKVIGGRWAKADILRLRSCKVLISMQL